MNTVANARHWSKIREAGTLFGLRVLLCLYRYGGRRLFSLMMYPVALYFLLAKPVARRASMDYLQQQYNYAISQKNGSVLQAGDLLSQTRPVSISKPHYGHVLLHFKAFAEVLLDKLLAWVTDVSEDDFELADPKEIEALLQDSRGQLIIGSHFGNLEYCRGFMARFRDKVINVLLYDKHAANFSTLLQQENSLSRMNVIQVDEFTVTTILSLREKIAKGEWVFIAGDRVPLTGLDRTVVVQFLGRPAPLPIGPYLLAKALECPVRLMFAYRHPASKKIYFEAPAFSEGMAFTRKERLVRLEQYAQSFANDLQKHCEKAPYQWFNFYDFWLPEERVDERQ